MKATKESEDLKELGSLLYHHGTTNEKSLDNDLAPGSDGITRLHSFADRSRLELTYGLMSDLM